LKQMLWSEVDVCGFAVVWGSAPHGAKTVGGVSLNNSKAHADCVYKIVSDRQSAGQLFGPLSEARKLPTVIEVLISNETKQPTKGFAP
jgi:hypothetical protein